MSGRREWRHRVLKPGMSLTDHRPAQGCRLARDGAGRLARAIVAACGPLAAVLAILGRLLLLCLRAPGLLRRHEEKEDRMT